MLRSYWINGFKFVQGPFVYTILTTEEVRRALYVTCYREPNKVPVDRSHYKLSPVAYKLSGWGMQLRRRPGQGLLSRQERIVNTVWEAKKKKKI
jgi:hypothetical protein